MSAEGKKFVAVWAGMVVVGSAIVAGVMFGIFWALS